MLPRIITRASGRLISWLLDLTYITLLLVAAPFLLVRAIRRGKYRSGWSAKLWGNAPRRPGREECVWFHAVSVGEVNLLKTVLSRFEATHPEVECVISTTTVTGFELAQRMYAPRTVFYCPLDFSWAVNRAIKHIRPKMLVLVELEIWPNLIRAAKARGVKVAVVNGRLSDRSSRGYARLKFPVRPMFRMLDLVLAQTPQYAKRFVACGTRPEAVQVTGSVKFDGAPTSRENAATFDLRRRAQIAASDFVFLAGSTQSPEESWAIETYRRLMGEMPQLRLILVPRHAERFEEVAALLDRCGLAWERRSRLKETTREEAPRPPGEPRSRILLVDVIGELGAWWGVADVGFVGGSTGSRGGQNMIEPAAYGVATCFGPNTQNFRDVVSLLLANDAAKVVRTQAEMTSFVRQMASDGALRHQLGERAAAVVQAQRGAAEKSMRYLSKLLFSEKNNQRSAA